MVRIRKAFNCILRSSQFLGSSMSAENAGLDGVDPKKRLVAFGFHFTFLGRLFQLKVPVCMVWIRKAFNCILRSSHFLDASMSAENEGLYGVWYGSEMRLITSYFCFRFLGACMSAENEVLHGADAKSV